MNTEGSFDCVPRDEAEVEDENRLEPVKGEECDYDYVYDDEKKVRSLYSSTTCLKRKPRV